MDQVLWVDTEREKETIWGPSECSAANDFHSSDFPNGKASIIPAERGWVEMDVVFPAENTAVNHSQSHKNPAFNFLNVHGHIRTSAYALTFKVMFSWSTQRPPACKFYLLWWGEMTSHFQWDKNGESLL